MLDGRSVRLAPLYDLLTYAGSWDGRARIDSAMSVDGEYALERISVQALVRAGARFGVAADEADDIVGTTRDRMLEAFEAARESIAEHGSDAVAVADRVIHGVRMLPLTVV